LFTVLIGGLVLAGCRTASFTFYGQDAAATTVTTRDWGNASDAVWRKLAKRIEHADGSLSYPSLSQGSKTWSGGPSKDAVREDLQRRTLCFDDVHGRPVKIETICVRGELRLVFVTYAPPGDPMTIFNEYLSALREKGVRVHVR